MNTESMPSMAKIKQDRIFNEILNYQQAVSERNDKSFKSLYEITSRLDEVCNRINSVEFEKNHPKAECNEKSGNDLAPCPTSAYGFVGELVRNNSRSSKQNEQLNRIIEGIFTSLNYIEKHI